MSIITDFINKFRQDKYKYKYAPTLSNSIPIFSQFGTDIYCSDVVQQAISCIVQEVKKLTPTHIREEGSDPIPVQGNLQKLLKEPNERMTISDLLEKATWQLFLNYNSFIVKTYDVKVETDGSLTKEITGFYPIAPTYVEVQQDAKGDLYYYFRFVNDYECTLAFDDVIHWKYRYSVNEYMGGNIAGQPDNQALLKTLELNDTLLQGVGKALKSSFAINGIVKYNTLMDDGKVEAAIKELENHLKNNDSGFLPLDIKGEFIPLQNKIQLVDEATLKFIDGKLLRHFGVSLPILTGDYTKTQYEAFYQKTLEPLVISLSQEWTKKTFSDREKSFGNKIELYPHELIFMDTSQKLELFNILVDTASVYKNELRTAFGKYPLPELAGQLAISSNKNNALNNEQGGAGTQAQEEEQQQEPVNNNQNEEDQKED
ncbi:MAG: phage portal protein [Enterococcus sp.]|nr:phage portal protein [Enterococcus sp.]